METVAVLTPTYNRREKLEKLYQSLCKQTDGDFIWFISDDGSGDGTEESVRGWIEENKIPIRYLKKENGGKHTAVNFAMPHIVQPLTFIVDSDDWLTPDAIETIKKDYARDFTPSICGFAYLRQNSSGKYLTDKLVPHDALVEDFCTCRYGRDIKGDMAEVWVTKCLKEFPFPEFPGEKFMPEGVVWIPMSKKYKMVFYNKVIYMCDYIADGLTVNRRAHNKRSPKGNMLRGEIHLAAGLPIKYRIRAMLCYTVYGFFAGYSPSQLWKRSKNKGLFLLCFPVSAVLYIKWR